MGVLLLYALHVVHNNGDIQMNRMGVLLLHALHIKHNERRRHTTQPCERSIAVCFAYQIQRRQHMYTASVWVFYCCTLCTKVHNDGNIQRKRATVLLLYALAYHTQRTKATYDVSV